MICTICAHLECCKVFSFGLMPSLVVFLALILCVCIPSCSPSPTVDLVTVMLKRSSLMHLAFVLRNKPAFTFFFNIVFFSVPLPCNFQCWAGLVYFFDTIWFGFASLLEAFPSFRVQQYASFDKSFFQIRALFQFFFFVFCYNRDLVSQGY